MDIEAVAQTLGVSVMTVRRLVKRQELRPLPHNPILKRPRYLLFSKAVVLAYKAAHTPSAEQA